MVSYKRIAKLLKFKDLKIVDVFFKRHNELYIAVKPFKNGCRCCECGRRGKIVRTRRQYRF